MTFPAASSKGCTVHTAVRTPAVRYCLQQEQSKLELMFCNALCDSNFFNAFEPSPLECMHHVCYKMSCRWAWLTLFATTYESASSYLVILFSCATYREPLCQAMPLGSFCPLSKIAVASDVPVFLLSSTPYTLPPCSGPVRVPF